MKTNTSALPQPLQQQSPLQTHFAQQNSGFRWGQSSVELAVTAALPWDTEGLPSVTSDCCTQGTQVQFCLFHHLLLIGKSKPLSPFFVAGFSRGEQSSPWVEVWSWAPRGLRGAFEACRDAQRCSHCLFLIVVTKAPHPAQAALKPALLGAGWQGQCWGAHGLSQKDTSSLLCCLYKESRFRATSGSVGCCHCDNTSSLLPGRRQNTPVKRLTLTWLRSCSRGAEGMQQSIQPGEHRLRMGWGLSAPLMAHFLLS